MKNFQENKTYYARSVCDHECIFEITVAKRTAKTIATSEGKRLGITIYNGVERVFPEGKYSMAPIITAEKEVV